MTSWVNGAKGGTLRAVGDHAPSSKGRDKAIQREIFSLVLARCADLRNKVISVHSRRAAGDVVSIIGPKFPGVVILHWFTGSRKALEQGIENGYFFSVNPAMTTSVVGRKIINGIPPERVLTESDGPFVSIKGRAVRPADLRKVIIHLAMQWECSELDAMKQVDSNFQQATRDGKRYGGHKPWSDKDTIVYPQL